MIIIPARLASTRFEHKILRKIDGVPMFVKTAMNAKNADSVLVACDDEKVVNIAKNYGLDAVLTSVNHESGTDRINEASAKFKLKDDEIIINVQADEPFFEVENLTKFKNFAKQAIENGSFMASCFKLVKKDDAQNPNLVKVVLDANDNALYFSRSLLPYPRSVCDIFKAHIGIYAYSVANLKEFCTLKTKELENIEKLEQLRALQSGKKIKMMQIQTESIGIDTKEDLEAAALKFGFKID
ncbi:3-deoxy-manno-octulosonate cytidylyltransferase [Campylobacter hyointestinalis]|uniref:3-deoxy-manno-octulosonate cytidylyltransferase n=1 Tax=Campylobacter hyointestinalis subsp. lawsonii TaxID=91353 RepID=A0AAV6EDQ1_CAMHY|nr:3-deoxy-manno-octulosonate cytidylyltransferase [Campylobacter hyointestinalis]KAB0611576.1 3-deoxy-manno-octulosonate cytidylyltransferase [Campylobacter hyointestinalis subsp. lawsonii]RAZ28496.1 3-deoxy-manno-octulosonate cytidylyltransferase [Campylobacter hyointestinalis subsp. lawsonii]